MNPLSFDFLMDNNNSFNDDDLPSLSPSLEENNQSFSPSPLPDAPSINDKLSPLPNTSLADYILSPILSFVSNTDNDIINNTNSFILAPSSSQLQHISPTPPFTSSLDTSANDFILSQIQPQCFQNNYIFPDPPSPTLVANTNSNTDINHFSSHQESFPQPYTNVNSLSPRQLNPCVDIAPIERANHINVENVRCKEVNKEEIELIEVKCSWCSKKHIARINKRGKPIKLCLECSIKKKEYNSNKNQH